MNSMYKLLSLLGIATFVLTVYSCRSGKITDTAKDQETIIKKQFSVEGEKLSLSFKAGTAHNHPTFAIWLETADGSLIQTLFVTRSIANGYYAFGDAGDGKWLKVPGEAKRPAALPYWLNRREKTQPEQTLLPTKNQPVPDAYTGATPSGDFIVKAVTLKELPKVFRVLVEVNQPWDWNKFWYNEKYPGDSDYKTSAQPSLVYAVQINLDNLMEEYHLNPIGHGHPSGKNGQLYTDISGFTTALQIFQSISLIVNR